jgi:hypothetical protein
MARQTTQQPPNPPNQNPSGEPSRIGLPMFLVGATVVVVVMGAVIVALKFFVIPAFEGTDDGSYAHAQATIGALQTLQASRQAPTAPVVAATAQPTQAPTTELVAAQPTLEVRAAVSAVPVAQPTTPTSSRPLLVSPTNATVTGTPVLATVNGTPVPVPTPLPELESAVSAAYLHYFEVSRDALFNLDPAQLDQVSGGHELSALQEDIASDRAAGRALKTDVEHNFRVLTVINDQAVIADSYRDSSIYVDAVSHQPLSGQVIPSSPSQAPTVSVIYKLQLIDGIWKVVDGAKAS